MYICHTYDQANMHQRASLLCIEVTAIYARPYVMHRYSARKLKVEKLVDGEKLIADFELESANAAREGENEAPESPANQVVLSRCKSVACKWGWRIACSAP